MNRHRKPNFSSPSNMFGHSLEKNVIFISWASSEPTFSTQKNLMDHK